MIRHIKRMISLGIDEHVSDFDAQRIRTLNIGILVAMSMATLPLPIYMQTMGLEAIFGPVLFSAISAGVLWLQSRRRAYEAALVVNILGLFLISLQWHVLGPDYGVHYWYLSLILFPFVSFPRASAWTPILLGTLTTLIFANLAHQDQQVHGYPSAALNTQILASVLVLALSIIFRYLNSRVEAKVIEQQERIDSQHRVIEQYPEQNPNPVLRLSGQGLLSYGNPAGIEILQHMQLQLGDPFPFPEDDAPTESRTLVEVEVGTRTYRFKVAHVTEFNFTNLYGTDITALKQLEIARAETTRALDRERQVSRLKEEFLASLSHELRTPLNAVLGLSEALQEEVYGPLTEKQGESLQTIWGSGQKLLGMFDDLLDFSRIGAGRFPTQIGRVDLRTCIQSIIHRHTRAVSEAGLRLSLDEGEGDTVAMVDMRHVQRIVTMLLQNAIKFTPKGGQVGIDLGPAPDPDWLQIVVWDTGIGISEEKLALLFEPFVQIEGGLARRYGGTGLGLALTSRLVRLLGARLMVESEEGEGSRFMLLLSRKMPAQLEVFADLSCPSCYALSEWLEESNLAHLVRWRGVEQHPGLSPEEACSSGMHEDLDEELTQIRQLVSTLTVTKPETISNTKRAMAAIEYIGQREPWRSSEARRLLYRAIWQDGRDVTEWSTVRAILEDFQLDDLSDESPELQTIEESTREWRARGEDRIPMLVPKNQQSLWHGLGERSELMRYIDAQLG